jgi:hypothetical protein
MSTAEPVISLLAMVVAAVAGNVPATYGAAPASIEAQKRYGNSPAFYVAEVDGSPQRTNGRTSRPDMLRRAEAKLLPYKLFYSIDPAMDARLKDRAQPSIYAHLQLHVNEAGKPISCKADLDRGSKPDFALIDAQCPLLVKRMQFLPALNLEGQRVPDVYTVWIIFRHVGANDGKPPEAIRQTVMGPAAAMTTPRFNRPVAWPIKSWMLYTRHTPSFQTPPFSGVSQSPIKAGETVTGIAINSNERGELQCTAVVGAENIEQNKEACNYVAKTLKPGWPDNLYYFSTQYPLLVVGSDKALRAIGPANGTQFRPRMSAEQAKQSLILIQNAMNPTAKIDQLVLWLKLGADGRAIECKIGSSCGSDAGDIGACRAMLSDALFTPGFDVFERPLPESDIGWSVKYARAVLTPK